MSEMDQLQLTLSSGPAPENTKTKTKTKTRNTADVFGTAEVKKGKTKKTSEVSFPLDKTKTVPKLLPSFNTAPTWAVQCKECRKWRVIPSQEEYEDIRKKIVEDPFTCKRKQNVSCNDSNDLEWGISLWVMDKPNLPKSPPGFKRKLTMRNNMNRLDCYYETPTGKKLRGPTEVASFLSEHLECRDVSLKDFDFRAPRIVKITTPLAG